MTIASLVVDPMHVEVGEAVSITVTLVGGLAPFTIQWTGLPPSCPAENISSFQCVPDDAGNWTVGVWVEDSLYTTVHSTATLTAYSPAGNGSHSPGDGSTPPGGSHSGLPLIDYALLGLAVALIVGLTAVVLLRRRPPIDSA